MTDQQKAALGMLGPLGWIALIAIYAKEQAKKKKAAR